MKEKQLTIEEKWKLDADNYDRGVKVKTKYPQCENCVHFIKGNAFNCKKFAVERKPREVLLAQKECDEFMHINQMDVSIGDESENKIFGGLFGFVIGDVLGVPVEFSSRQERDADPVKEMRAYGTYHQPFGSWSDDTSFTLCLLEALESKDIIERLKDNMVSCCSKGIFTTNGQLFDIGISTQNAIDNMRRGIAPAECGGKNESDNGNGSLMRVLPLAFIRSGYTDQEYISLIENVSSVTHGHNRSKLACVLYVIFASNLYSGMNKDDALDSAIQCVLSNCQGKYKNDLKYYKFIFEKTIKNFDRTQIKSSGYVVDTLEAVIWAFFNNETYEDTVLSAINLGGDTDTIGAIVGGIAGIYYGYSNIPNNWIQNIINKENIASLCSCLNKRNINE